MRIKIKGISPSVFTVKGYLAQAGYDIVEHFPDYTVTLELVTSQYITLDSVDSELEAGIVRHIRQLTAVPILIATLGTINRSDVEIVIGIPGDEQAKRAVELGVFRGLIDTTQPKKALPAPPPVVSKQPWYKRIFG